MDAVSDHTFYLIFQSHFVIPGVSIKYGMFLNILWLPSYRKTLVLSGVVVLKLNPTLIA